MPSFHSSGSVVRACAEGRHRFWVLSISMRDQCCCILHMSFQVSWFSVQLKRVLMDLIDSPHPPFREGSPLLVCSTLIVLNVLIFCTAQECGDEVFRFSAPHSKGSPLQVCSALIVLNVLVFCTALECVDGHHRLWVSYSKKNICWSEAYGTGLMYR